MGIRVCVKCVRGVFLWPGELLFRVNRVLSVLTYMWVCGVSGVLFGVFFTFVGVCLIGFSLCSCVWRLAFLYVSVEMFLFGVLFLCVCAAVWVC